GSCGISCAGVISNGTATCAIGPNGVPRCEVATCNTGYYQAGPLTCLPATDNSCTPCLTDANCQNPGDKCLLLDGVRVCGKDCAAGNIHGTPAGVCPTGFECAAIEGAQQCVPRSRSCACLEANDGQTRSCGRSNASGQCFGTQSCSPAFGWTQCSAQVPAAETCNFIDDDCNGLVDEVAGRGDACNITNGFGTCTGVRDCLPGFPALQCVARTPAAERCDYVDNDCNGFTDEGFNDLGTTCFVGNGACRRFGVRVCSADGSGTECNAIAGTPTTEICDGVDNDCNDRVDEDPAWGQRGTPCTLGAGVCQVTGVIQCSQDGQSVVCSQTPPNPAVSTEAGRCNNLDDDCDGAIDEDFTNKGQVCSVGQGVCRAFGNFVCAAGGASTVCDATPLPSSGEVCDLLDNDCDGGTDENFKNGQGQYATATTCGNCFTNCEAIYLRPRGYGVCDATGSPTCKLQCCRAGDTNPACDGGNWYDLNAVPDDGCELRLDPDAIYVSTSDTLANDVQGCGRGPRNTAVGAFPCKTIGFGLSEAVRVNRGKVLVADGLYTETVTLVAGKQILGGHRADTWERSVAATNTTLRGPTTVTGHAKTVIADGITTATVFEGFIVYGGSAFGASANSYAFWIRNSNSNLVIRNNLVFGGDAGDGAEGSAGGLGGDG
ncbi:MAG TPA: MopE-related protein, partial [Myxococcota bacterium]|nr:MopE-related protein [Myxococcota bacterium]